MSCKVAKSKMAPTYLVYSVFNGLSSKSQSPLAQFTFLDSSWDKAKFQGSYQRQKIVNLVRFIRDKVRPFSYIEFFCNKYYSIIGNVDNVANVGHNSAKLTPELIRPK